ncbi:MAG: hypothetical protein R2761_16395 [Acidimicrobiales bacterium]
MIIAVASRKASPGVTSLTAWLADNWSEPGVTRLIVEADPSGGSLAARWSSAHGLTWDPGLLTLSTSRSVLTADTVEPLAQRLAGGVLVAAAPPAPEQVIGALTRWGDRGAAELAAAEGVRAFVDCGRLTAASPALTLARRAAITVLVCRPRLDEVNALVPAVAELTAAGCTLGLVCVGSEPYLPAEIANAAGLPLLGVLPVDSRAAAVFDRDGLDSGRSFRRSALAQTAAELTEYIRSRAAEAVAGPRPADTGRQPTADLGGDPTSPAPVPAPRPIAAALAPEADPSTEAAAPVADGGGGPDGGLPGPGPTRLSNPVGPTADADNRWPPPRPVPLAADPAESPPPPGAQAIPVSLAIAAARARAQGGQDPPAGPGNAGWPPPPPPDGPAPTEGDGP